MTERPDTPSNPRSMRTMFCSVAVILVGGAVTGLAVSRGGAAPEGVDAMQARSASGPGEAAPRFTPEWWDSQEATCPPGARFVGAVPPEGFEAWCALESGVRHGPHVRWHHDGREAFVGRYVDGVLHGKVTEWFPSGRRWREGAYDRGVRRGFWIRWTEDGAVAERVRY